MTRSLVPLACAVAAAAIALGFPAATLANQGGCLEDSLGHTFCPRDPNGVAVRSGLGEIVCARGRCVQEEDNTAWHCSRKAGGWARIGHNGPECEHGCYGPTEGECRQM